MRLSSAQIFQQGINAILEKQSQLHSTELQLASGKKILTPSEDPLAAVQILDISEDLQRVEQFSRNADIAEQQLGLEETVLAQAGNVLQRVRELIVQANNDTQSDTTRHSIAVELEQRRDELLSLANTKDANGEYIFSGYQSDIEPFAAAGAGVVYNGDNGQRFVQLANNNHVAVRDPGDEVFMAINTPTGNQDVFTMLQNIVDTLNTPVATPADRALLHTTMADGLNNMDSALEHLVIKRADVGARLNQIDSQRELNESFNIQLQESLSNIQDLDYAEAISRMNLQLTALQAAQQAYVKTQGLSLFNHL